jgi:hypothetical protein
MISSDGIIMNTSTFSFQKDRFVHTTSFEHYNNITYVEKKFMVLAPQYGYTLLCANTRYRIFPKDACHTTKRFSGQYWQGGLNDHNSQRLEFAPSYAAAHSGLPAAKQDGK